MRSEEFLIVLLIAGALLILPVAAIVMSIIAFMKTRKLKEVTWRLDRIEAYLRDVANGRVTLPQPRVVEDESAQASTVRSTVASAAASSVVNDQAESPAHLVAAKSSKESAAVVTIPPLSPAPLQKSPSQLATSTSKSASEQSASPVGWETFIGQKAFGWVAAILFLFSATFFLRYAYQNNWIGPVGRVAIGELFGAGLVISGCRYLQRGLRRFASMLMSTGIVVIYLATYSAFGFYQLLPQQHAGMFLAILVMESMLAAIFCRSSLIGMIAVVGGLMTPLLMQSDHDSYSSLFLYLVTLNIGVVAATSVQRWRAVASVAFSGTQLIYLAWYQGNYHPEKFAWALGFQLSLFAVYLIHSLIIARRSDRSADYEELARFVINAVTGFVAFRTLTQESWSLWIGTAALVFATIYAIVARLIMAWRPKDSRLMMTSLAVAIGFIAWAIPVQADARWISLGWTMMAMALWLFGLRISSSILRAMAAALATLAAARVIGFDLPFYIRDPFIPVFNRQALPSLAVGILLLAAVLKADRYLPRLSQNEHWGVGITGVCGITLVWLVLSLECHGYFVSRSFLGGDVELWRWRAQLALTVFWILFATALLLLGFRFNRSRLRWFAMGLFGVTVLKLFIVDMANVQQIYRIVAFFILAVVLGLVARGYQRFKQ
jgi:uncharacterized membrane protein